MKAHIAIIAITAFLQASAVPFPDRPSLLGSFKENLNNVISQGQEIIEKGKEVVSENVENVIENIQDLTPDQITDLMEEFPLAIDDEFLVSPNEIIEDAKETLAEIQEGISDFTPEQVPTFIQDNFPDIPFTEEDVANVVEQFQNLQAEALEAINQNFNICTSICSQIRNAIKKTAAAFVDQISKLIRSAQSKMVHLIERGEVFPSRTLDVIEKSANEAINGFEKIMKALRVPEGIIDNTIPVMREATEKNMEIARTYVSYLGGSKLGEMVEKIKTELENGISSDVAVRQVFTNKIQSGLEKIRSLKVGNQQSAKRGFFGDIANIVNQFMDHGKLHEEMYEMRQRYENNIRRIQARIYEAMMQVEEIGNQVEEGFRQNEVQEMIATSIAYIRENFEGAISQNFANADDVLAGFEGFFESVDAQIAETIFGIMNQVLDRVKNNVVNVIANLEEIAMNAEYGDEYQDNYEEPPQDYNYRPVAGFGAPASFSNPDWEDPDRIFLTLI